MASEPTLSAYIAASVFLTAVVGVFALLVARSGGAGTLFAVVGFLVAFSTIHLLATNALIRNWLRYAAAEEQDLFEPSTDGGGGDGTNPADGSESR